MNLENQEELSVCSSHVEAELQEDEEKIEIGASETKKVFWSRLLVFAVLLLATIFVSSCVYLYLSWLEVSEFEKQADEDAKKILAEMATTVYLVLGALDSLMVEISSYAASSNSEWPFVTVPHFAVKTAKVRSISKAFVISYGVVVDTNKRTKWEAYAENRSGWVEETIDVQKRDVTFKGQILEEWYSSPIHSNSGIIPYNATGPFIPNWQTAPTVPLYPPYNWDIADNVVGFPVEMDEVVNKTRAVFSLTRNLQKAGQPVDTHTPQWVEGFVGKEEDPTEPLAAIYYPILEDAYSNVDFSKIPNRKVVGVLAVSMFWRDYLRNILPGGSNGIFVVIGNDCDESFTYEILGPEVKFLGAGDRHQSEYDDRGHFSTFINLHDIGLNRSRTFTGLPLSPDFCPHWIKVYPSDYMKNDYTSFRPALFSAIAALIFLFTSIVFSIYVYFNEVRQTTVLTSAVQSSTIVSSLFPENVRDRLYDGTRKQQSELESFLANGISTSSHEGSPIADCFPETTVFFADIAGFTKWSSSRDPPKVFTLLEKIYGAFDATAKKRGIFKIETIGDCYVAVAGLPKPNPRHATAMVRFASDCREQFNQIVTELNSTLGEGTADLALRIGMHSGPCTAGVLRGEKARFQIFGDTVNTASRIESNGQPNRIHVSQTTADALVAAQKSHWLTRRADAIEAKGKGKLVTYWAEIVAITGRDTNNSAPSGNSLDDATDDNNDSSPV